MQRLKYGQGIKRSRWHGRLFYLLGEKLEIAFTSSLGKRKESLVWLGNNDFLEFLGKNFRNNSTTSTTVIDDPE